jgi:hypothetical protein
VVSPQADLVHSRLQQEDDLDENCRRIEVELPISRKGLARSQKKGSWHSADAMVSHLAGVLVYQVSMALLLEWESLCPPLYFVWTAWFH